MILKTFETSIAVSHRWLSKHYVSDFYTTLTHFGQKSINYHAWRIHSKRLPVLACFQFYDYFVATMEIGSSFAGWANLSRPAILLAALGADGRNWFGVESINLDFWYKLQLYNLITLEPMHTHDQKSTAWQTFLNKWSTLSLDRRRRGKCTATATAESETRRLWALAKIFVEENAPLFEKISPTPTGEAIGEQCDGAQRVTALEFLQAQVPISWLQESPRVAVAIGKSGGKRPIKHAFGGSDRSVRRRVGKYGAIYLISGTNTCSALTKDADCGTDVLANK
jgi:hypothetical protein